MLYNGCGFRWSVIEAELLGQGAGLWEGLVDVGLAVCVAQPLNSPSPPGYHLLLPADAHADCAAAGELPNAVRKQQTV